MVLSTVGTRKAERKSWRGLYPMKPALCGTWSAESWNAWVPPLSANGMICLLTSSAGSSEHAASGKSHDAAVLKTQVARFLHDHKGASGGR